MFYFSSEHLRKVFEEEGKYEAFRNLCFDLNHGNEIYEYDEDGVGRKLSKHEANQAIRKILMEVCELTEEDIIARNLHAVTVSGGIKKFNPIPFPDEPEITVVDYEGRRRK